MPAFTYNMLRQSSRERERIRLGRNRMRKKSCNKASLANKQHEERSHIEANKQHEERTHIEASKQHEERTHIEANEERRRRIEEIENRVFRLRAQRFSMPFQIGFYSPGTEPDHIPYHLYMLVKEAVDIMKRSKWYKKTDDLIDLTSVEKKINFFCTYFHSHLPKDWEYDRDNASSLIAGYDTVFANGPRYLMSSYTPLGDQIKREFDSITGLWAGNVVDIMRIVHSRKTPTPETFMKWGYPRIIFYCRLCSLFGIDYQHLETASEDDVCLMNMGS